MFYHAINGEGTGPVPPVEDLSPVLLWTNPSPSVAFATQTVELDLSEYAGVLVEVGRTIDDSVIGTEAYFLKNDTELRSLGCDSYPVTTDGRPAVRRITVTDSGVSIGNCIYSGSGSIQNTACIPIKIYGVKKYVVEPVSGLLNYFNENVRAVHSTDSTSSTINVEGANKITFILGFGSNGHKIAELVKGIPTTLTITVGDVSTTTTATWEGNSIVTTRNNTHGINIYIVE